MTYLPRRKLLDNWIGPTFTKILARLKVNVLDIVVNLGFSGQPILSRGGLPTVYSEEVVALGAQ